MSQDRLEEIEINLAHQEKLVLELNQVVYEQQKQIYKLEKTVNICLGSVRKISDSVETGTVQEEKPPHY